MDAPVNPLPALHDRWLPLATRSVELLCEHQEPGCVWPASSGFAPHGFSWLRDGSFIADGASAAGLRGEADRFHRWCARVLERELPPGASPASYADSIGTAVRSLVATGTDTSRDW